MVQTPNRLSQSPTNYGKHGTELQSSVVDRLFDLAEAGDSFYGDEDEVIRM